MATSEARPPDGADEIEAKRRLLQGLLQQGREQDAAVIAVPTPPPVEAPRRREPPPAPRPRPAKPAPRAATRPARDLFDTSVVTQEQVAGIAVNGVRLAAYAILVLSFAGSILAFDGNWQPSWRFWEGISPAAALAGIALQVEITLVEWWRGGHWKDPVYLFHLALDAILTFLGFWPLLGQPFSHALALIYHTFFNSNPSALALDIIAKTLFAAACIIAARWPEKRLVKRPPRAQEAPAYA